jgi:hypothetical protein
MAMGWLSTGGRKRRKGGSWKGGGATKQGHKCSALPCPAHGLKLKVEVEAEDEHEVDEDVTDDWSRMQMQMRPQWLW